MFKVDMLTNYIMFFRLIYFINVVFSGNRQIFHRRRKAGASLTLSLQLQIHVRFANCLTKLCDVGVNIILSLPFRNE